MILLTDIWAKSAAIVNDNRIRGLYFTNDRMHRYSFDASISTPTLLPCQQIVKRTWHASPKGLKPPTERC